MSNDDMHTPAFPVVVIGLGNSFRSDDGVGLAVAATIRGLGRDDIRVVTGISDGVALMEAWQSAAAAFVVDAAIVETPPGTVHRFDALRDGIPEQFFSHFSTHAISIPQTVALAKTLDRLPPRLIVYGITGADFSAGDTMTPPVAAAIDFVVTAILDEIRVMA